MLEKKLFEILEAEKSAAEALLGAAQDKQNAIVKNDLDSIKSCTASESKALSSLYDADRALLSLIKELECDEKNFWSTLTEHLSEEDLSKANQFRDDVQAILLEAKGINNTNQCLINVELDHIDFISKLMLKESADYSPGGTKRTVDAGTRLVDIRI